MSFSMVPRYAFQSLTDINPDFLEKIGVKFLMIDLDNTIASYSSCKPSDGLLQWIATMKSAGVELFIVSNSIKRERVEAFAKHLGIGSIGGAKKPLPRGVQAAMKNAGFAKHESALVGDQIFTDTIAANSAGVVSIIVHPLSCKNPIFAFRFFLERPFRAACKNRNV